jgi:hypothetical protein
LLLYAVFLVITSAKLVCDAVANAESCGNFRAFLVGCHILKYVDLF